MIQAAFNRNRNETIVPKTSRNLLEAFVSCIKAGADCIYLHVRDEKGLETLDSKWLDLQVGRLK